MLNKLFYSTDLMQKSLDATWLRFETISQNIANVDTPGYKSKSLSFEDEFRAALLREDPAVLPRPNVSLRRASDEPAIQAGPDYVGRKTREGHIDIGGSDADPLEVQPYLYENNQYTMKMDGNNVDAEAELNEAAKTTIYYYTMINKVNSELGRIQTTLNDIR